MGGKKLKQNLFKAICPVCRNKVLSIMGWVKIINKNVLPDNLPEERCPDCLLEVLKENTHKQAPPLIVII